MRVVIVGGRSRADYLMGALAETVDTVVAINDDRRFCEYLSSRHDGTVIWGNGMKLAVLEEAGVAGFDAIVALTGLDADNLAICQVAKKFLGIRIQLCIVSNPENTAIFRQLGVTAAISATATLAQAIRGALELPDPADAKARAATAAAAAVKPSRLETAPYLLFLTMRRTRALNVSLAWIPSNCVFSRRIWSPPIWSLICAGRGRASFSLYSHAVRASRLSPGFYTPHKTGAR